MGIAYNRTQIIQGALNLLGYGTIQAIQGTPAAEVMDNLYDGLMAADLGSPNWRFASKVQNLSQIAGVDPGFMFYNTAYQIPPDCLAIWQVWPPVPYEVFGEQIWTTGVQQLQIQYRALGTESKYPPAYIQYFMYLLACTVGPGSVDNPTILAQLNADMNKWRTQAMVVNTQGRPNKGLGNSPWVNSRPAGSFYLNNNNGNP